MVPTFTNQQRVFLAEICRFFHSKADWPTHGYLDRHLKNDMDVLKVGRELALFMYDYSVFAPDSGWDPKRRQPLGVSALYTCQAEVYANLEEILDTFALTVSLCIEAYDANEDDDQAPQVTSFEVRQHKAVTDLTLRQVYVLLEDTNLWRSITPRPNNVDVPSEWEFRIADSVRDYRGVRTIEDFVERRRQLAEEWQTRARGFGGLARSFTAVTSDVVNNPTYIDGPPQSGDAAPGTSPESPSHATEDAFLGKDVFIVYGHDRGARHEVARFIENQIGLRAIMLDEIPGALSKGVFEAVEKYAATADFAVVIMTPDDVGSVQGAGDIHPRTRQNVLIELGYFWHMLGRERIVILKKGDVEIPSDFHGILYAEMDEPGAWHEKLRGKMQAADLIEQTR